MSIERRRLERVRAEVQKGMDDLENGRYTQNSAGELVAFMDEIGRQAEDSWRTRSVVFHDFTVQAQHTPDSHRQGEDTFLTDE